MTIINGIPRKTGKELIYYMSFQISKVKGIPIRLHFTLVIVFFLIAWTLASGFMPQFFPNLSIIHYWIMGIVGAIILFISVLLHELAHSLLSLRYGLKVRQIILFIFGGVSDIKEEERIKEDYGIEFRIAIVGPLTSFALAGIFALSWWGLLQASDTNELAAPTLPPVPEGGGIGEEREGRVNIPEEEGFGFISVIRVISGVLLYAAIVNVLLGAFNLLPAFPLDGGRMLRAGLIKWKKSYSDATRIAVKVGTGISYGLMAFGFITIISGSFIGGFWLILIGWFLQSGAQAYLQQHELSTALSGVRLRDIMNTKFVSVRPDITIKELLNGYFNIYRKSEFPVTTEDNTGDLLGSVTTRQAMNIPESNVEKVKIERIMTPTHNLIVMNPDNYADEALKRMYQENKSRVFVCINSQPPLMEQQAIEQKGEVISSGERIKKEKSELLQKRQQILKLVGIISKTDLLNIATERQEFEKEIKKLASTTNSNRQNQ
jgi:Zn-dependent protease/predicted transcriptional regulator